jgi:hypothetical protein
VGQDNAIKAKGTGTCDKIATESNVDAVSLEEYLYLHTFAVRVGQGGKKLHHQTPAPRVE